MSTATIDPAFAEFLAQSPLAAEFAAQRTARTNAERVQARKQLDEATQAEERSAAKHHAAIDAAFAEVKAARENLSVAEGRYQQAQGVRWNASHAYDRVANKLRLQLAETADPAIQAAITAFWAEVEDVRGGRRPMLKVDVADESTFRGIRTRLVWTNRPFVDAWFAAIRPYVDALEELKLRPEFDTAEKVAAEIQRLRASIIPHVPLSSAEEGGFSGSEAVVMAGNK